MLFCIFWLPFIFQMLCVDIMRIFLFQSKNNNKFGCRTKGKRRRNIKSQCTDTKESEEGRETKKEKEMMKSKSKHRCSVMRTWLFISPKKRERAWVPMCMGMALLHITFFFFCIYFHFVLFLHISSVNLLLFCFFRVFEVG